MENETPRGRKNYPDNKRQHVKQGGGDELNTQEQQNGSQEENRQRMGVNEAHKTEKMEKAHRGTYP
jgi:hypothetical protein